MQIEFKYHNCHGFGKIYNYELKHFNPYIMITKKIRNQAKNIKLLA